VDPKSATLGLAGTREKQIALDSDHSHICKFDKADGDDYEQVIDNLVDLVESATKAFEERQRLESMATPVGIGKLESAGPTCT